ncbi:glycosyltransferase family 2 protein [Ovoidimarina sediminis]|uniref:glycosyltransferase family 2 protein n=1 Tax=Ovoidimarina sediminis TaxID=3079856 RepID=UPI00290C61A3|nr:glycosyltransferase family 2 protein [Rhodophyticola sp. MJ-SS7]MDU8945827.1 glycosyltransferase family 2 protein [Rhodophyticola sp. MJ-SS7]
MSDTSPQRFVIVTTMKNEGAFMLEWIAYSRSIGFTDFVIFTNDCEDGTDKIAARLDDLGIATHVPNRLKPGVSPQRKALRRARFQEVVKSADWLMSADVDEFLNIRVGSGHLSDLMDAVGNVDAISICWKLFGNGGHTAYRRGFVTEQFFRCAPENRFPNFRARGVKTLFRNSGKFARMGVHRPRLCDPPEPCIWVDGGGNPVSEAFQHRGWKASPGFTHDYARLHHYAVRSVESFLVKRDRGRTNHVNVDQGLEYWRHMNANHRPDKSILERLSAARLEYGRLLADDVLASLHEQACRWHEDKINELLGREGWPEFRRAIGAITGGAPTKREAAHGAA